MQDQIYSLKNKKKKTARQKEIIWPPKVLIAFLLIKTFLGVFLGKFRTRTKPKSVGVICVTKNFPEGTIKPCEGTSLSIGKVLVSFWLKKSGETLISGLRRKGIILRALMWAVTHLWP